MRTAYLLAPLLALLMAPVLALFSACQSAECWRHRIEHGRPCLVRGNPNQTSAELVCLADVSALETFAASRGMAVCR